MSLYRIEQDSPVVNYILVVSVFLYFSYFSHVFNKGERTTWSCNPHTKTLIPGKASKSGLIGV
jgi:hypothetical protein